MTASEAGVVIEPPDAAVLVVIVLGAVADVVVVVSCAIDTLSVFTVGKISSTALDFPPNRLPSVPARLHNRAGSSRTKNGCAWPTAKGVPFGRFRSIRRIDGAPFRRRSAPAAASRLPPAVATTP